MVLYKFKALEPFDHVTDILLSSSFYCPTVRQLNDPLEGVLGITAAHVNELGLGDTRPDQPLLTEDLWSLIGSVVDRCRVCSFSESPDSLLMWSYYGGSHTGICFEVEVAAPPLPLQKVVYLDDLSAVDISRPATRLGYKLKHWEHEREYRVIFEEYERISRISVQLRAVLIGRAVRSCYLRPLRLLCERLGCRMDLMTFTVEGKPFRCPYPNEAFANGIRRDFPLPGDGI